MGVFDGFKLLVIEGPNLDAETVRKIRDGVSGTTDVDLSMLVAVKKATAKKAMPNTALANITHIVANDTDFIDFEHASDAAMIPVVTSTWVMNSIENNKLEPVRQYSPDPKLIFNGCVISCSESVGDGDRWLIERITRAFGAIYMPVPTKRLTHLITVNESDQKCVVVKEFNKHLGAENHVIKVVSPSWLLRSTLVGRKIAEDAFTFPNPAALDGGDGDVVVGDFLSDVAFALSDDLGLSEEVGTGLQRLISTTGAADGGSKSYTLSRYRSAVHEPAGTHRGSIDWILWMILHKKWINPWERLLFTPPPKAGVDGSEDVVASATNYTGDARLYIQDLVEYMGGTFTKTLKEKNTHLLTARAFGRKYEAATKHWDVRCVNHLWLEDSYATWMLQDDTDSRYGDFPRDDPEGVQMIGTIGLTPTEEPTQATQASQATQTTHTTQATQTTQVPTELPVDDSEEVFQEAQQVQEELVVEPIEETGLATEESVEEVIVDDVTEASAGKRKSRSQTPEGDKKRSKKASPPASGKPYDLTAIMTGCDNFDFSKADRRRLRKVGIRTVDIATSSVNCVVCPKISTSVNFLTALSSDPQYMVSPLFFNDVLGTLDTYPKLPEFDGFKPEISNYALSKLISPDDWEEKAKYFLEPAKGPSYALNNLVNNSNGELFEGFSFNVSDSVPSAMATIIEAFGAAKKSPKVTAGTRHFSQNGSGTENGRYDGAYTLLCSPGDKKLIANFKKQIGPEAHYLIVEKDWVLRCIFNAQLVDDKYVIEENV